jgi:hypothetical protein
MDGNVAMNAQCMRSLSPRVDERQSSQMSSLQFRQVCKEICSDGATTILSTRTSQRQRYLRNHQYQQWTHSHQGPHVHVPCVDNLQKTNSK